MLKKSLLFDNIYTKRKVFITGHTGFKGSWLALWLKMLGAEVTGYSLLPDTNPNLFSTLKINNQITHQIGDIRNYNNLFKSIAESKAEIVFHLAAQPLVRRSYKNPLETFETNILGTVNLLEAARNCPSVKCVVNVTSDKCYQNQNWIWGYRENDPMGGYDPYSCSKGCAELITSSYQSAFFSKSGTTKSKISLASARAGNVIGGGDWAEDRLIPDFVRAINRGVKILIRSPKATRPWQYVLEPLSGYLHLGSQLFQHGNQYSGGWNFGPGDHKTISVEELINKIIEGWDAGDYEITADPDLHEAHLLRLDTSKANKLLSWNPVYDFQKAIDETICWYKNYCQNKSDESMIDFTCNQIAKYVKHAIENSNNTWIK